MKNIIKLKINHLMIILLLLSIAITGCDQVSDFANDTIKESKVIENDNQYESAIISRVVDGDTIVVILNEQEYKVRLIGIDSPESVSSDKSKNTPAGEKASEFTKELLSEGTTVWLEKDTSDTDRYGRLLRYVYITDPTEMPKNNYDKQIEWLSNNMVNSIIIINGHAEPKPFEPDTRYKNYFDKLN